MNNYRKIFSEGLNADDDFSVVGKGQWVNASGIRTFTTDNGATGRIEAIRGSSLIFNTLPAGTNKCIGGCADESKKWIVFKNWNSNGNHGIYCYDKTAGTTYTVLLNADVTGGLNFSKYSRIDSNCKIIGDLEYFTDNSNEPRRLNIKAAINHYHPGTFAGITAYSVPVSQNVLYWIRRQPGLPPTAVKSTAGTTNNFIKEEGFWFLYRYIYRDYETSTLSALSTLQNYNTKGDTYDTITITLPTGETIEQDVQQVDLCVKYASSGKIFVMKSWNKDVAADATAITGHNSGTGLSYAFINNKSGIALDNVYSAEPYDSLPIYAKTIELAKNRAFMANNTVGYDTTTTTSLTVTASAQSSTGTTGRWVKIDYGSGAHHYFLDLGNLGFFDVSPQPVPLPYPTTEDYTANLTKVAGGPADFGIYVSSHYSMWTGGIQYPGYSASITSAPAPNLTGVRCFKSAATYQTSISFLDFAGRKCGILTKDSLLVDIPGITYDHLDYTTEINWSLDNTNALTEIPLWAQYYSINVTKCLTTRFFIQLRIKGASYVTKDSTGAYLYTTSAYSLALNGCAFDTSYFDTYSIGYKYTDGDIVRVFKSDGTTAELKIIADDGKYIITELKNLGALDASSKFLIEIYTPYKTQITEPQYEVAQIFKVTNPGTSSRAYSTIAGQIEGDVTILKRNDTVADYLTEAMSPIDKYWQNWNTDHGRVNTVDTIGQKSLINNIAFSDVLIEGTKVNGLSSFSALNVKDLDSENGSIQKLQLANKVQQDGTVMLSICEEETVSMYLGEQELFDTQGSAFIAQATGVIGSVKALKGSRGTSNPESVFEYNGQVYWWDTRNAGAVQYSNNGLYPISNKKFVRPSKLFSQKFVSLTTAEIEALGSNPYIIGGFDPYHKEALFTIPSTEATPPKGMLTDFPSVIYPYDIYDGKGKTLIYKHEADMWFGDMPIEPEFLVRMDSDLYAFKDGSLYLMNQGTPCNWFGVQYKAKLMYANNPGAIHTFLSIGLESNKIPDWAHFATEDPYTQSSDLPYPNRSEFVSKEGVIEANILRDRFSPNAIGSYDDKQLAGDYLFGKALLVMLQYEFINDPTKLQLRVSDIGNNIRTGTLINKQ